MFPVAYATLLLSAMPLNDVAKAAAYYWNTSVSLAVTLPNGITHAAAGGFNDRVTGSLVDKDSVIPGGSICKFITSLGAMRLAETGKLKLDDPIGPLVDPWLKTQGHPSLKDLWGGDETIAGVTPRQLLSMRGGLPDYDDGLLRRWTVENPNKDWEPIDFIHNVSKSFLFPPGQGGSYSGISYVLMGWVLCAATGCSDWTQLQQQALIEHGTGFKFDSTIFMTRGPCHQYDVVHQYLYAPAGSSQDSSRARAERGARLVGDARAALSSPPVVRAWDHCQDHTAANPYWYNNAMLKGKVIGQRCISTGGAAACCAAGDTSLSGAMYWMFVASGAGAQNGTCYFYGSEVAYDRYSAVATAGRTNAPLRAVDFVDLFDASCLNGWTMGNVATTPSDMTRLYQAAFNGAIVSQSSLSQMQDWHPLTTGFAKGAPYGLGLFHQPIKIPIVGTDCKGFDALCKCTLLKGCHFADTQTGHPGLDYGSGFPSVLGHYTGLNASLAAAFNNGEEPMGMNFTMGGIENNYLTTYVNCRFIDAAVHLVHPTFPDLDCGA